MLPLFTPAPKLNSHDAKRLSDALFQSMLPDEDKKWWGDRIFTLNIRQAKQLWEIIHAKNREDLDQIIEEENQYQIKLKKDLNMVVKEGTKTLYKIAEDEDKKKQEEEIEKLMKE